MQPTLLYNILRSQLKHNKDADITVTGISMEPTLHAADVVLFAVPKHMRLAIYWFSFIKTTSC
jgi:predicted dinucleotide-binding enzyme